jgi:hypothetical protein
MASPGLFAADNQGAFAILIAAVAAVSEESFVAELQIVSEHARAASDWP